MITVHLRHRNAATHSYKIVKIEGAVVIVLAASEPDAAARGFMRNYRTGDIMGEDEVSSLPSTQFKIICT